MNGEAFLELCQQRHSVRQFQDRPVERTVIDRILACARTAPYASGRKGWDILAIEDRALIEAMAQRVRDRATAMAENIREGYAEAWDEYSRNFHAFAGAPVVFLPVFRPAPALAALVRDPDEATVRYDRENHIKSISGATMLLLLAAQAEGLGACPMTGPLIAAAELHDLLGLRHGRELAAVVPVGHLNTAP